MLLNSLKSRFVLSILPVLLTTLFLLSSPGLGGPRRLDDETVHYKGQRLSIKRDPFTRAPLIIWGVDSNLHELKNFLNYSRKEITV